MRRVYRYFVIAKNNDIKSGYFMNNRKLLNSSHPTLVCINL